MCGIAGLVNYKNDRISTMNRMLNQMIDRGPNGVGVWADEKRNVVFGHRRLAIMDLSENGSQPMITHSGRLVISYNGEVYNHKELAQKLIRDGYIDRFYGTSDTEILLESIDAYGLKKTLEMLNGMFALAVYDKDTGVIKLARDRVGEKPLYYGFVDGAFVFASDLRCFECVDNFNNEINTDALAYYFKHGTIASPNTIYKDIYVLEPGTILTIVSPYGFCKPIYNGIQPGSNADVFNYCKASSKSDIDISYETYWSMIETAIHGQSNLFKGTKEEAAFELEQKLKKAIQNQSIADVSIGAFLSGGVDSSTIVSLMQEITPNNIKTFTIGVDDAEYNEARIASKVAEIIGTDHTEMYVSAEELKNSVTSMAEIFDQPFADSSQIPTFFVNKMAKEHVTVSLSGDGGDELFGGYNSYRFVVDSWKKVGNIPYCIRGNVGKLLNVIYNKKQNEIFRRRIAVLKSRNSMDLHNALSELSCLDNNFLFEESNMATKVSAMTQNDVVDSPMRNAMLFDLCNELPNDILCKVDRTSMKVSLECRAPYFDKDIIEFAWTLPDRYLVDDNAGKSVLREILYKRVPKELIEGPKKGFSIPIEKWLKEDRLRDWAESLISDDALARSGVMNKKNIRLLWDNYMQK
jgi:asparagine synthase (glutamine-hydrolysing)